MTPRTKAKLNENLGLLLDFLRKKHGSTDEETERMLFSALSWTAEDVEIQRQHPASDHEMLCEIWEATRKMMAALDEVCYRTAISSREEQEAHDQKVRAEMLEEAAKVMCWMCACGTKTHLDACGNTIHEESSGWLRCFAQGIRSLAAPAASKPEADAKES